MLFLVHRHFSDHVSISMAMYAARVCMLCFANNVQYNRMALVQAAQEGDTESVNHLLKQGANFEAASEVIHLIFDHPFSIKQRGQCMGNKDIQ